MRRRVSFPFFCLPLILALITPGCAELLEDGGTASDYTTVLSFTQETSGAEIGLGDLNPNSIKGVSVAQSIQLPVDDTVIAVTLKLRRTGSFPSNSEHTVSLSIETDSSDHPSGTRVESHTPATLLVRNIGTTAASYNFVLPVRISLSANTTYWIRLTASYPASTSNYIVWYGNDSSTNGYSNGNTIYETEVSGQWSRNLIGTLRDMVFTLLK